MNYRDFGLSGRTAFVCGSSSGLGLACAHALAAHGAQVWINGRNEDRLQNAAEHLKNEHALVVNVLAADVTTHEGRRLVAEKCPAPDVLVTNAEGPPPGDFRNFSEADWNRALNANMLSPIMLIQNALNGMIERGWGRILNITSTSTKAPLPLLHLSNGARSGLTGFVSGLAREVAVDGVTINNLLPGRIETDRLQKYCAALAAKENVPVENIRQKLAASNPMRRFGRPEEIGALCAFLSSEQAAYITGQNFVVDGGEYPGL